jgi:acetylornithine deacetylase
VDAIIKTGAVLVALEQLDGSLAEATHPLLGRRSVHASEIKGGVELSSYPGSCTLRLERRTLPGETVEDVEAEVNQLLEGCRAADPDLEATHTILMVREPFEIGPEEELVGLVAQAAGDVLARPIQTSGASYWADSAFIAAAGIPTVLFGPSGEGAHATEEWVSLSDTEAVAHTLVAVARRVCA